MLRPGPQAGRNRAPSAALRRPNGGAVEMSNPPDQAGRPEVGAERFLRDLLRLNTAQLHATRNLQAAFHDLRNATIREQTRELQQRHPNPLCRFGRKFFSQTDEDGITLEILRRIALPGPGIFAEFGPGDGAENNTLILAALGWRGFWVGNEDLRFDLAGIAPTTLTYLRDQVTLDNLADLTTRGLRSLGTEHLDVVSFDFDGNDIYFLEALLERGIAPALYIVEYNGKFPPPIRFQVTYDPAFRWNNDDYMGASLCSMNDLFERFDYKLVCCNAHTGNNAFFVRNRYAGLFPEVPASIDAVYSEPRYHLYTGYAHPASPLTLRKLFERPAPASPADR